MIFYILYTAGYIISNILPLKAAYWVADRLTDLQYYIVKKDREAVAHNLSIVLKKDIKECRRMAHNVFRNFGLYLVDFLRMHRLNREDIERRVRVFGIENLDQCLKGKKGVIALTSHIGNWEMGGVVAAMLGYDIAGVVLRHKYKKINDFFTRQRENKGLKAITMGSVMKRCISFLKNNGMLALVGDRDFANSGIRLKFFGIPTSIPRGPALLSLKIGSPIIPVFFVRVKRYNYNFIFCKPIEVCDSSNTKDEDILKRITEKCITIMEEYIREYPDQWLMFRPFWKSPKDSVVI